MVIQKYKDWGEAYNGDCVEFDSEFELAQKVLKSDKPINAKIGSGSILRNLGISGENNESTKKYPIDLGVVILDGQKEFGFISACIIGHLFISRNFNVVMNSSHQGDYYLAPKSHPNDGLLDVTTGSLPVRQRIIARKLAKTGSHLDHPNLSYSRISQTELTFKSPKPVFCDSKYLGKYSNYQFSVIPDAFYLIN